MKSILVFLFSFHCFILLAQKNPGERQFNLDCEKLTQGNLLPDGWFRWGSEDYNLKTEPYIVYSGKSAMVIEAPALVTRGTFGCVAMAIPADYLGKEIELRAYMKLQDSEDSDAGLVLRVDDKYHNILAMETGHQRNLRGVSTWNSYSVSIPFPAKAKTIYIGALLSGHGKLWVDDFEVLIDGKDISKAKRKAKIELRADRDHEFDYGSKLNEEELSKLSNHDLFLLAKLWGFLKYYHPSVAKGNYNMDYELFRVLSKLATANSELEKKEILLAWVKDIVPIPPINKPIDVDSVNVKLLPDLNWLNDTSWVDDELNSLLHQIKNAKRTDSNYYVEITDNNGTPEFINENPYDSILFPDAGFQLLGLYRYWNVINYFYPYKNLIEHSWDSTLIEYIPRFIQAKSELEYKLAVLSLITRINDSNSNIMAPNAVVTKFKGENRVPVDVSFIENKAVITGTIVFDTISCSNLKVGDVVLKIDNQPVEEIVKHRFDYTPASTPASSIRNIGVDLLRTNDSILPITYQRGDTIKQIFAKCYDRNLLFKIKNNQKGDSSFFHPAPGIVLVNTLNARSSDLEKAMPELFRTKGVIIDLRGYPKESLVAAMGKYFVPSSTAYVEYTHGSILMPGLFSFAEKKMIGGEIKRPYKGKVVVLINEQTQGIAEYLAMALKTIPGVVFVGSNSAGANGNLSDVYLPGSIRTMMSSIGIYFPDRSEIQRSGIEPHVHVLPTIKSVAAGQDLLLEKAIQLIQQK